MDNKQIAVVPLKDNFFEYPSYGLTPEILGQIFKDADDGDTARQAELFMEIEEKDPHIFSQFQIRKLKVQGLDWKVESADTEKDVKVADEIKKLLKKVLQYDNILDMLDAIPKGYSALQMAWDVSTGQADLTGMSHIDPRCITFYNDTYSPYILTVDEPITGIPFPPNKIFYHRYKARSGYDTRAGILRVCSWMYLFKNYAIKDWSAFAEVYGMPLRLGYYDPMTSEESKKALVAAVKSLGTDAAGVISKDTEIKFISATSGSGNDSTFEKLITFCDSQCSKAIRGQVHTAKAESEGIGTYGMGKADDSIAFELMEADCISLASAINDQIIKPFILFNYGPEVKPPIFSFIYKRPENLKELVPVYKMLKEIGFPMSQEHVSERFGVPMLAKGETPLVIAEQPVQLKQYALKSELQDRQSKKLAKRAVKIMSGATSFEEVRQRLDRAFPDMKSEELEKILGNSMFGSVLEGYEGGIKNNDPSPIQ